MSYEQPDYVDVSAYVVIKPKWHRHWCDAQDRPLLEGATIDKTTVTRPRVLPREGGVVSKVTFRVDANALLPLQPEAVIHITAGDVELTEVQAVDPREEGVVAACDHGIPWANAACCNDAAREAMDMGPG